MLQWNVKLGDIWMHIYVGMYVCESEDAHVWGAKGFHNHAIFLKCIHHKTPGESVRPYSLGSAYNSWQQLLVSRFTARLCFEMLQHFKLQFKLSETMTKADITLMTAGLIVFPI